MIALKSTLYLTLVAIIFVFCSSLESSDTTSSRLDDARAQSAAFRVSRLVKREVINPKPKPVRIYAKPKNKTRQTTTTTSITTTTTTEATTLIDENESETTTLALDDDDDDDKNAPKLSAIAEDYEDYISNTTTSKTTTKKKPTKGGKKLVKQKSKTTQKTTTTTSTTTTTTKSPKINDDFEEEESANASASDSSETDANNDDVIEDYTNEEKMRKSLEEAANIKSDTATNNNKTNDAVDEAKQVATLTPLKKSPLVLLPFIEQKNASVCTPEAYLEFPRDPIGSKWRSRGLILIHISIVCYTFYALAIVCEKYFMPSLEEFAQRLQISEDVAGATLMSAGSSAPELFTAILGVFIAKGDVGTGAIVGSAVFNILFIIGICAFVSTTTAQLSWWPVLRDSVYYTFTVLVLIFFIYDERVTALESFTMLALYGVYIVIMIHNEAVKRWVTSKLLTNPITAKLISTSESIDVSDEVFGPKSSAVIAGENDSFFADHPFNYKTTSLVDHDNHTKTVEDDSMFMAALLIIIKHKRLFRSQIRFQSAARYIIITRQHKAKRAKEAAKQKFSSEANYFGPEETSGTAASSSKTAQQKRMAAYARSSTLSKNKFSVVGKEEHEFWNMPPAENENYYVWLAKIPVNYVLHFTIPNCSLYPDMYLYTFLLSILWTAIFSYIMVWMVTLIGYTFGIPDSVMGFSFLAAGTSVPDCYSSILAARNGMADMAVSNSIGSNVFDILVGLALPWFIQSAIYPGVVATINSRGVIYSVILLFLSLIATIYLLNKYEWTLNPRLGFCLLITYLLFIGFATMLEYNVFGNVNPPPCPVT